MERDKELLLIKDLCSRVPYNTKVSVAYWVSRNGNFELEWDKKELTLSLLQDIDQEFSWEYIKPYLRPMSSMTEEERKEYKQWVPDEYCIDTFDWLNAHHFDYRGLIKKGLAIEVSEKNNPYEN